MSSMQGMRKASVLPLPVFAAARTSLQTHKGPIRHTTCRFAQTARHLKGDTDLPSSRGRMLLCWISVMCSKPISFTPFNVFSLTSSAREAKDVSSNAPGLTEMERLVTVSDRPGEMLRVLAVGPVGRVGVGLSRKTTVSVCVCLC